MTVSPTPISWYAILVFVLSREGEIKKQQGCSVRSVDASAVHTAARLRELFPKLMMVCLHREGVRSASCCALCFRFTLFGGTGRDGTVVRRAEVPLLHLFPTRPHHQSSTADVLAFYPTRCNIDKTSS